MILAADNWPTNAELISDVASLYFPTDPLVLDATFGRGIWWRKYRPTRLITSDRDPAKQVAPHLYADFRRMPFASKTFDVVAYDPPYVCVGGRTTTTIPDFHERFGIDAAPKTPRALQALINDGLAEMSRVVKSGGLILVKCMDYISSGKLQIGTYHTLDHGVKLGLKVVDKFDHIGPVRPQPERTRKHDICNGKGCEICDNGRVPSRQIHARRNVSTLFVFQK